MRRPSYLILHGYQASGPGHWQTWLAGRLRSGEATVAYPDLPDADSPQLRSWLEALAGERGAPPGPPGVRALPLRGLPAVAAPCRRGRAAGVAAAARRAALADGRARGARRVLPG